MPKYVIFDLDNCLADDRARIPLINWEAPTADLRYEAYHWRCGEDEIGNFDVFCDHIAKGAMPIFLTARPLSVESPTRQWLLKLFRGTPVQPHYHLIMRNIGDHRPSVDVKRWQVHSLPEYGVELDDVIAAYDDREDVVEMYRALGLNAQRVHIHSDDAYARPVPGWMDARALPQSSKTAADVLAEMAATFRERNAVYRDNYKMVPALVRVLFPDGVPPHVLDTDHWHLFELKLVKLARFASTGLTHIDSIHDDAVYSAMIEAILSNKEQS